MSAVAIPPEHTENQSQANTKFASEGVVQDCLSIVSGVQAGAKTPLDKGRALTLGRGYDNDIVVREASIGSCRVQLLRGSDGIELEVLEGSAIVEGIPQTPGERRLLSEASDFVIGEIEFSIGRYAADESLTCAVPDAHVGFHDRFSLLDQNLLGAEQPSLPESSHPPASTPATPIAVPWYRRGGIIMAMLLLTGGVALWMRGAMVPAEVPRVSMATLLESTSLTSLVVEQNEGFVQVSGFLESLDEAAELERIIQISGYPVDNQVQVGERIQTQVSDIFRVNGVPAEVTVFEEGTVSILTRVPDEQLLQRVEDLVLEDVPGIATIEIDNRPPDASPENAVSTPVDDGKRVAMVVSDSPAYIVTEDKSRYFVGSLLPSGHRVASIEQGTVMLEKKGVRTLLEF